MSTRSHIGMLDNKSNNVRYIYCHWDGYPEYVGYMLNTYYKDRDKVEALINLGDISKLDKNIYPKGNHSFDEPEEGVTVSYNRDRGETWDDTRFKTTQLANYGKEDLFIEYSYLFRDGEWYVNVESGVGLWTAVSDLLKNN